MQESVSVVIADAQHLSRLGLKRLLNDRSTVKIVGEAMNESSLLKILQNQKPRILIIDYNSPGYFSEKTIEKVNNIGLGIHILVISSATDKKSIYRVLEQGVNSFLTKTCGVQEVLDAVEATSKGEKFFCTRVVDYLLEKSFAKEDNAPSTPLTAREIEIVQLVAKGLIAKEIADILNLSTHTIYTHRKNIMKKLNLNTTSELVLYAVNNGFVALKSKS